MEGSLLADESSVSDEGAIYRGAVYYRRLRRQQVTATACVAVPLCLAAVVTGGVIALIVLAVAMGVFIVLLRLVFAVEAWNNQRRGGPGVQVVAVGGVTAGELKQVDPTGDLPSNGAARVPITLSATRDGLRLEVAGRRTSRGRRPVEWKWSSIDRLDVERMPWAAFPVSIVTVCPADGAAVAFCLRAPARFIDAVERASVTVSLNPPAKRLTP
jgi:hypothetical protein